MHARARLALSVMILLACPAALSAQPWIAFPDVIEGPSDGFVRGVVFEDLNGDGTYQRDEPGVQRVLVSNGRDVTMTNRVGAYMLPVREEIGRASCRERV